jgi:NADP-dependent 3-hydroxy acid dehydrogenase YdfG
MKTILNIDKKTITAKKGIKEKDMKSLIAITGVSSGIGEVTARIFSDNGYPLLPMARRIEKLWALSLPNRLCK